MKYLKILPLALVVATFASQGAMAVSQAAVDTTSQKEIVKKSAVLKANDNARKARAELQQKARAAQKAAALKAYDRRKTQRAERRKRAYIK